MKVWTFPPNGRIVVLKWWQFSYSTYMMLLTIQRDCPNQVIELVGEPRYIPVHMLNMEDWNGLKNINA
ncbi:MAG: hypothetical protein WC551_02550 [Patescibacteria group bacterium]